MRLAPLVLVAAAALPGTARADAVDDELVDDAVARPIRVRVELAGAVAKIHLTVKADAGGSIQSVELPLPPRAVVTGATVRTGKRKRVLALTPAADAAAVLGELEQAAATRDMGSAIAIAQPDFGPVAITALVPRRTSLVLDLELEVATCFLGDHRHLAIPAGWLGALEGAARRQVVAGTDADGQPNADRIMRQCSDGDRGWLDDDAAQTWLALPTRELASRPAGDARIGTLAGRFVHGAVQAAKIEVALAGTLSAIPDDLATAFVVDGSRSVTADLVETQRALIASYLAHAPRTAVQVITFDRVGRALLPRWTRASAAGASIDRQLTGLALRNGSDLDAGLAEAGRWLRSHTGTRRVVVFTDELFPARLAALDPAHLATLVPAGTVIHAVAIGTAGPGATAQVVPVLDPVLFRDDSAALAPLAAATEGMPVRAPGSGAALDALALARPTSLDQVRIIAPGFEPLATAHVSGVMCVLGDGAGPGLDLAEGEACTYWATGPTTLSAMTVEGLVWGRRWRQVVELGDRAAIGIARELWSVLDRTQDGELLAAADRAARAVSSQWSLVARWGGAGGYVDTVFSMRGSSGCGCGGGIHDIGVGHVGTVTFTAPPLADQVGTAITACRVAAPRGAITIAVETTRQEIVGVSATVAGITGAAATTLKTCVEAAVWDLGFTISKPPEHQTWTLAYPGS